MRLGHRQPRRRDPRRRFRNRLLLGMVVVALLPLVVFAVLAVFELDTVAKSTANATEAAILQRQEDQQHAALGAQAAALDGRLTSIDTALVELAADLAKSLHATTPASRSPVNSARRPACATPARETSTRWCSRRGTAGSDGKFATATVSKSVTAQITEIRSSLPEVTSIWLGRYSDRRTAHLPGIPRSQRVCRPPVQHRRAGRARRPHRVPELRRGHQHQRAEPVVRPQRRGQHRQRPVLDGSVPIARGRQRGGQRPAQARRQPHLRRRRRVPGSADLVRPRLGAVGERLIDSGQRVGGGRLRRAPGRSPTSRTPRSDPR